MLLLALVPAGCGADYDTGRRTSADPGLVPPEEAIRFELSGQVLPVSRASWLERLSILDKRHWPAGAYADYLEHRRIVNAMGRKAPSWPTPRADAYRFEDYRNQARSVVVRVGGETIVFVTCQTRRRAAKGQGSLPGSAHDVVMLRVGSGRGGELREELILDEVQGGQPDAAIELQALPLLEDVLVVWGTTDSIMQMIGTREGDRWVFSERRAVHRLTAPARDLRLAGCQGSVHVSWTVDRRGAPRGGIFCSSTQDPRGAWGSPIEISSSALNGRGALLAEGPDVYVAWTDDRLGEGGPVPPEGLGWVFVARSADAGATFDRPVLVGDPEGGDALAADLLLAVADTELLLYWSEEIVEGWPQRWHKALLDRDLDVMRAAGTVAGGDLLNAYRRRMTAVLTGTVNVASGEAAR
jgi:hypothetical protein